MTAFLSNDVINLRPVRRSDLALLAEWRNDPEIRRATREWRALTEADQEHWFQRISGPDRRDHMFVVERTSDGLPVGVVGLVALEPDRRHGGNQLLHRPAGRARPGAMRGGALTLLLDWGFDVMRLERIVAETYAFNDASFGLLTSLGFVVEGRMRAHVHRDGRRWDANILGLLRDEWRSEATRSRRRRAGVIAIAGRADRSRPAGLSRRRAVGESPWRSRSRHCARARGEARRRGRGEAADLHRRTR